MLSMPLSNAWYFFKLIFIWFTNTTISKLFWFPKLPGLTLLLSFSDNHWFAYWTVNIRPFNIFSTSSYMEFSLFHPLYSLISCISQEDNFFSPLFIGLILPSSAWYYKSLHLSILQFLCTVSYPPAKVLNWLCPKQNSTTTKPPIILFPPQNSVIFASIHQKFS